MRSLLSRARAATGVGLTMVAMLAALCTRVSADQVVYQNDFEGQSLAGWSTPTAPGEWANPVQIEQSPTGRKFLGRFGQQELVLQVPQLPTHSKVTVSFDLYIIGSWDGYRGPGAFGPDVWALSVAGGPSLLYTNFGIWVDQAYPGTHPNETHPWGTGASENNVLAFPPYAQDSAYTITREFNHEGDDLSLLFNGLMVQEPWNRTISDESWGIDNITIAVSDRGQATATWAWGFGVTVPTMFTQDFEQAAVSVPDSVVALDATGGVWTWFAEPEAAAAYTPYGVLGRGGDPMTPGRVEVSGRTVGVAAGNSQSYGVRDDGTVWGCGFGSQGALGFPCDIVDRPVNIPVPADIVALSAGAGHCLALARDGTVWSWGFNEHNQVGHGPIGWVGVAPAQVPGVADAVAVAAGYTFSLVLLRDGTVLGWGENRLGQLGRGTTGGGPGGVGPVIGLSGVVAVSTKMWGCAAVCADGGVYTWGKGGLWLGTGSLADCGTPTRVAGLGHAVGAWAGAYNVYAAMSDGSVYSWGWNQVGMLGIGTEDAGSSTPVLVPGLPTPSAIAWGAGFGLAICPAQTTDSTPPVTASEVSPLPNQAGWHTTSVTVRLLATDEESGVDKTLYRADGGTEDVYTGPFTVGASGDHVVAFYSKDQAGNTEAEKSVTFRIDSGPPVTVLTCNPEPNAAGWNNTAVTLTLTASDDRSGVASTTFRLNGGSEQTYSAPIVISGEGAFDVAYWSSDVAGNVEQAQTRTIRVDTIAPTTTAAISPDPNAAGWHKGPVTVTLNATDEGSGVAETLYSLDGGAWQGYAGPIVVEADGDHTVRFYSNDHAGNTEAEKSVTFRIDSVPPVTVLTCIPEPNAAGWNNTAVALTLTASDDRSGVAGTTFRLNGGSEQTYSAPIVISGEGEFDVAYWSSDVAHNVEQAQTRTVRVDTIAPTTTAAISPDPNAAGWRKSPVTVTLNATDEGSGVDTTFYKIGTAEAIEYAGPVVISAEGDTSVTFWSVDVAGNTETAQSRTIRIDLTAPVITITSPEDKTYIINEAVTVAYACTDAVSGVASCDATLPNGAVLDTTTPGARTFVVTATDAAGNSAQKSVGYVVAYGVVALYDQTKAHSPRGVVPIKIRLVDAAGANLSSADIVVHAERVVRVSDSAPGALEAPGDSNPDLNFWYDATLGGYQFNLKLSGYATGTYRLYFSVAGDPTDHTVEFQVK